eukprot:Phypoly_transcript_09704.p1 GENE.Phypoly_transcript_09704~~Phypoly_transcript_09704.p1  ORF type:complete len:383 (+),score=94.65 Phypoly_transcript_09704:127-1275(+)
MEQDKPEESKTGLISQLLSVAKKYTIGADVTSISVSLPEGIESKQTVAEIFQASTMRHLDILAKANKYDDPVLRTMHVVWWFFASNPTPDAKKPLNPTLGEISRAKCSPLLAREGSVTKFEVKVDDKRKSGEKDMVSLSLEEDCAWSLAEQVSHHPPITAHFSENKKTQVGINGFFESKAKFTGTGLKLTFEGDTSVMLNKFNEVYSCTPPTVIFKIIRLAAEVVGEVEIVCNSHPYKAILKFKEKPFLRGEANKVKGVIVDAQGQEVAHFDGTWTKQVVMHDLRTKEKYFFDYPTQLSDMEYPPFEEEEEKSARKVWQHVKQATSGSKSNKAKQEVEEEQRRLAKKRAEAGIEWEPKYFEKVTKEDGRIAWRIKKGTKLEF